MDNTNRDASVPKRPRDIEKHPILAFWKGTLTIVIDRETLTPWENASLMKTLFEILPHYSHWTRLVKIAIRTAIPSEVPEDIYSAHIADMKFLIDQLNDFKELKEVHMCVKIHAEDFRELKLGAGLFGLENAKWRLGYKVNGGEYVEIDEYVEVCERDFLLARLLEVYQSEFLGGEQVPRGTSQARASRTPSSGLQSIPEDRAPPSSAQNALGISTTFSSTRTGWEDGTPPSTPLMFPSTRTGLEDGTPPSTPLIFPSTQTIPGAGISVPSLQLVLEAETPCPVVRANSAKFTSPSLQVKKIATNLVTKSPIRRV